MTGTLRDRIRQERRRQFVGRRVELANFQDAVRAEELPFAVLQVYGPGGVGKTTLLRQYEAICAESGLHTITIDARNLQPTPDAVLAALMMLTGCSTPEAAFKALTDKPRSVVFIDTFEAIQPLDTWIRESFLPELPSDTLTVLLGRRRPSAAWRSDVWQSLCRAVPLRNLTDMESRAYLDAQNVPSELHASIVGFTHGFPLALSLIVENYVETGGVAIDQGAPDIVLLLLERFLEGVEDPYRRDVLELCSLVRMTTEALIAQVVDRDRASELFSWLRSLSFVEITPFGLMPHDLAREAISRELRWRNVDRFSELHHRARKFYGDFLDRSTGGVQLQILFDYIYLHRDNPMIQPFFQWYGETSGFVDAAQPVDLPQILRIVERHEGEESAKLAEYWFKRQAQGFLVVRDATRRECVLGFLCGLNLETLEGDPDPAIRSAFAHLHTVPALRSGEKAILFRFWMADDGYQSVTPVQSLLFVAMVQSYFTEPGMALTYIPFSEPEFWAPMFQYAIHPRCPEADFEVNGRHYGVYIADWRALPTKQWLDLLGEQEVPVRAGGASVRPIQEFVVLSQDSFQQHVLQALKTYNNDSRLATNPLLGSRLVLDKVTGEADVKKKIEALRTVITEEAQRLNTNAKDAKLLQAIHTCYLRPMRSQELAAERLDVSIATYRRHLKAGVTRLTDALWQLETGS